MLVLYGISSLIIKIKATKLSSIKPWVDDSVVAQWTGSVFSCSAFMPAGLYVEPIICFNLARAPEKAETAEKMLLVFDARLWHMPGREPPYQAWPSCVSGQPPGMSSAFPLQMQCLR